MESIYQSADLMNVKLKPQCRSFAAKAERMPRIKTNIDIREDIVSGRREQSSSRPLLLHFDLQQRRITKRELHKKIFGCQGGRGKYQSTIPH